MDGGGWYSPLIYGKTSKMPIPFTCAKCQQEPGPGLGVPRPIRKEAAAVLGGEHFGFGEDGEEEGSWAPLEHQE